MQCFRFRLFSCFFNSFWKWRNISWTFLKSLRDFRPCTVPVRWQFVSHEGLTKKISFSFFKTWYLVKASWMRTANNGLLILPSCMCHASFHINHLQQLNRKNTLLWCWVRCYFCTCICIGLVKMWMFVLKGIPWPLSITVWEIWVVKIKCKSHLHCNQNLRASGFLNTFESSLFDYFRNVSQCQMTVLQFICVVCYMQIFGMSWSASLILVGFLPTGRIILLNIQIAHTY